MNDKAEDSYVQCQWIVTSYYNKKECNRMAPENIWGLSLCWQHSDAAFKHVVCGIEQDHYGIRQVEELAQAILSSINFSPNGHENRHPKIATIVESQIIAYLDFLIHHQHISTASKSNRAQAWWTLNAKDQIDNRIECLIQKRLEQKFN